MPGVLETARDEAWRQAQERRDLCVRLEHVSYDVQVGMGVFRVAAAAAAPALLAWAGFSSGTEAAATYFSAAASVFLSVRAGTYERRMEAWNGALWNARTRLKFLLDDLDFSLRGDSVDPIFERTRFFAAALAAYDQGFARFRQVQERFPTGFFTPVSPVPPEFSTPVPRAVLGRGKATQDDD